MKLPPMPLLSQRDFIDSDQFCNSSTVQGCVQDYCACTHVLRVNLDSVVEIILVDEGLSIILYFYIICTCNIVFKSKLTYILQFLIKYFYFLGFAYDANHPFHLHGYQFRVIAMERIGENVTVDKVKALDKKGAIRRNLDHAPLKDTVTVPDGGYTVVRFYANNPGIYEISFICLIFIFIFSSFSFFSSFI